MDDLNTSSPAAHGFTNSKPYCGRDGCSMLREQSKQKTTTAQHTAGAPPPPHPRAPAAAAPTLASVCGRLPPRVTTIAIRSCRRCRSIDPRLFGRAFPRCRAFYYSCCGCSRPRARWAWGSGVGALPSPCVLSAFVRLRAALRLPAAPRPRCALVGRALPFVARPSPRAHLCYALPTLRPRAQAPRVARGNACNK